MASSPVSHPLAPPSISGNTISVDTALNQPTRVTRTLMDLTLQRFIADRLFTSDGGVTGGAVIYDQQTANELYAARDVQQIAPGGQYPIIEGTRLSPQVAPVEKWGGKFYIFDEARDRNDARLFSRLVTQLGNTIVRKLNQRTMALVDAAIASTSQTFGGHNWATGAAAAGNTTSATPRDALRDIAHAQRLADIQELGTQFDLLLVNPQEAENLSVMAGSLNTTLENILGYYGIREVYSSNRVTAGTAYLAARGQVGGMRVEQPLATKSYREDDADKTWVQSGVRPVFYVDAPYNIIQITGLAG